MQILVMKINHFYSFYTCSHRAHCFFSSSVHQTHSYNASLLIFMGLRQKDMFYFLSECEHTLLPTDLAYYFDPHRPVSKAKGRTRYNQVFLMFRYSVTIATCVVYKSHRCLDVSMSCFRFCRPA